MKFSHLVFYSKNNKSLLNAILFFLANSDNLNTQKHFSKKTKKKILTILKSPHVNKTAQEQFEINTFSKQLLGYNIKSSKFLFFFKSLKENTFADLKFKIKFSFNKKKEKKTNSLLFTPTNLKLHQSKSAISQLASLSSIRSTNSKFLYKSQIKRMLGMLDVYGTIKINKTTV